MPDQRVKIAGPTGALECVLTDGDDATGAVLLLCHPHPQYGGSMHDEVLDSAANALSSRIRSSLRFNFRGVGASEGSYDGGDGEVDDVVAAATYLTERFADARLWVLGYSFGAAMVWRARARIGAERLLLIAPPMGAMTFDGAPATGMRIDAIYGDADEYVDADAISAWSTSQSDAHLHAIPGCDHFFSGHHRALARVLSEL